MLLGVGTALAGAAAAFVSVGAAIAGTISAANTIDALTDKANGLGESVGDLQAFQFALEEAGNIDGEKTIAVLNKLTATVGSIATGANKEGVDVFKQLGIDAQQLSLEGPIRQFEIIQEKLAGINNNSERAATAQKLFGKAALDLLPALNAQSDSMRESAEYAKKVGAAVSEEGAAGVAAMNDAVGRVQTGFKGLFNTLAVQLAPGVEAVATALSNWIPPIVYVANVALPRVVDAMANVADAGVAVGNVLGANWGTFADAIAKARQEAKATADELAASRQNRTAIVPEADEGAAKRVDDVIAGLERQIQVAMLGEDIIKAQEQRAAARNEQERERIRLLQDQLTEFNSIVAADEAFEKESKKAEEEAKRRAELTRAQTAPQTAVQGRLLTRGTGGDIGTQMLNVLKQIAATAQKQLEKTPYEKAKAQTIYLKTVTVP